MTQLQEPQNETRHTQKRLAFLVVTILLLIGGALVWILNITGLVIGPWSSIFVAVFTALGVVITLLQWHLPYSGKAPLGPAPQPLVRQHAPNVHLEEITLGVSKRKGALMVKVRKSLRGSTINLYRGFDRNDVNPDAATNVVLRIVDGFPICVAIFTTLEPGKRLYEKSPEADWHG